MIGGMKTEAVKDRIIPLNDKMIPLVKNRYDPNKKYPINNKFGNHYTYGTYMNGNFNACMGKPKMKHLPHDGMHTFASLMDSAGANDVCIKLIMGHSMKKDTTKGMNIHKTSFVISIYKEKPQKFSISRTYPYLILSYKFLISKHPEPS